MGESDADDTFRILVATDTHLGYMERDGQRGDDSFIAFDEVLRLARKHDADFVLLGGDLFHENKPSKGALTKCVRLLKKHCLGSSPVRFEYLGDPSENFSVSEPRVNFHDPDLNIALPVFSIHGNHDDLSGPGDTAALDILSEAGLVNYFGRCTDLRSISLSPLLLQKGPVRLAIYGLSNVKDERLFRLMRAGKVSFLRPREYTDEWFNIFVLHQNRAKHGPTNYIPEEFLESFLDVAIWGHEHENRIRPEFSESSHVHIIQPGSSVATSLCEGEAVPKSVGLLCVRAGGQFRLQELPLQTVRPLVFDTISLSNVPHLNGANIQNPAALSDEVDKYIDKQVDRLIEKAKDLVTGDHRQPTLPLIRLRVQYPPHLDMFHPVRFGQKYAGRIANPNDLILLRKDKPDRKPNTAADVSMMEGAAQEREDEVRVEDYVKRRLAEKAAESGVDTLGVLSETGVTVAVHEFVTKGNTRSFDILIEDQMQKAVSYLDSCQLLEVSEASLREQISEWRSQKRIQRATLRAECDNKENRCEPDDEKMADLDEHESRNVVNDERSEMMDMFEAASRSQAPTGSGMFPTADMSDDNEDGMDVLDTFEAPPMATGNRRGARRGRGSRGPRGSRGARSSRGTRGSRGASTRGAGSSMFIDDALEMPRPASKRPLTHTANSTQNASQRVSDTASRHSSTSSRVTSSRVNTGIFFDDDDE